MLLIFKQPLKISQNSWKFQIYFQSYIIDIKLLDTGHRKIITTFESSTSISQYKIWEPRKSISVQKSFIFFIDTKSAFFTSILRTVLIFTMCSFNLFDHMMILLRQISKILPVRCWKTFTIYSWWVDRVSIALSGTFSGITKQCYNCCCIMWPLYIISII